MESSELNGILAFLRHAEQLKNTLRSAWTSKGRPESTAEHTWRLCLMAMLFEKSYPDISFTRLIKMCIVHDLGEVIGGDIPAIKQLENVEKSAQERKDLLTLIGPLPACLREEITDLWDDYEQATSPEARLAKALDKLETILQHNQGKNPENFDYRFNLDYGKQFTTGDPLIEQIREILDQETTKRDRKQDPGS